MLNIDFSNPFECQSSSHSLLQSFIQSTLLLFFVNIISFQSNSPDTASHTLLGELLNFWIQHILLSLMPYILIVTRQYELYPNRLLWLFYSWSICKSIFNSMPMCSFLLFTFLYFSFFRCCFQICRTNVAWNVVGIQHWIFLHTTSFSISSS